MMRADNQGEGGILSLMALAQSAVGRRTRTILVLGMCGAALFYGDAIITPAISVLSAVEGLKTAPGLANAITPSVEIAITLVVLVALFMVQSRGTAKVASWFGPICLVWFVAIGALGLLHIPTAPRILLAFNPLIGLGFLAKHGIIGLFVLGSVSLTITGAEALYADMGHFGRLPIQAAWVGAVFPALALNYLGQGAFALHYLATGGGATDQDWFFLMAPAVTRVPLVVLATAATIIASQAVISGAYSLSSSAMQMGLLPRLEVRRTSGERRRPDLPADGQLAADGRRHPAGRNLQEFRRLGRRLRFRRDRHHVGDDRPGRGGGAAAVEVEPAAHGPGRPAAAGGGPGASSAPIPSSCCRAAGCRCRSPRPWPW